MADSFLQSLMGGYKLGSQIKEDRQQSKLAQLASQAYAAPQQERAGIVQQAVGVDPSAGFALGDKLQGVDDQRTKTLVQAARYLTAAPESARPGIYQQMKPTLAGFGMQVPDQYDDTVAQTAQALVQAYGDSEQAGPYANLPSDIRSLKLLQENPELAALDRQRRQAGGMVPKLVQTDQGFAWGTPGAGIQLAPLAGVAGQTATQSPAPQLFAALSQKYGLQPTSTQRTTEHNRDVGGVPNSFHLSGQAADFVVPQQYKEQFAADARANGYEAIDEGDHVHIEPAGSAPRIAQPKPAASETAPSALEERIRIAREMGASDDEIRQIAIGREGAAAGARPMPAAALRMLTDARAALKEADTVNGTLARIRDEISSDKLELGPVRNIVNRGRVAAGMGNDESSRFSTMMTSLRGLQNAALRLNKGVQTEGDAKRIWEELLGNLNDEKSVLANIDRLIELNNRAVELHEGNLELVNENYGRTDEPQPTSGSGGQSAAGGAIQRARNPQTGEVIELRNGQWVPAQ